MMIKRLGKALMIIDSPDWKVIHAMNEIGDNVVSESLGPTTTTFKTGFSKEHPELVHIH